MSDQQEHDLLALPFFVDKTDLPASLPSEESILDSSEVLVDNIGRRVVRVGEHFVVKYGFNVVDDEAMAMMYVRKNTSIPIPRLLAAYKSELKGSTATYIITEYIEGQVLSECWHDLDTSAKCSITATLKREMDKLKKLSNPDEYFGGIGRRHMPNGIFWAEGDDNNTSVSGPFNTEAQLNEALALRSDMIAEFNGRKGRKGDFYRRMLPHVLKNHRPVLTHGDFQRKNIIIRPRSQQQQGNSVQAINDLSTADEEGLYEVFIIDWEQAGWYPDYWEFCAASWAFTFYDDWADWLEQILKPYPVEYPWLTMIGNELWS